MRWHDLHIFGADEPWDGWASFKGIQIGASTFFDEIFYVLDAPCAAAGSIMAIGVDLAGPGGFGDKACEPSLVLASSFESWLSRIQEDGWIDYGLVPGSITELPSPRRRQLREHFLSLNPKIKWGSET